MKIEKCRRNDLSEIKKLDDFIECSWTMDNLYQAFDGGVTTFLKSTVNEKIVGYVSFDIILDELCINNIAVDAAYRRQGIAIGLLEHVFLIAANNSISRILLEVNEHNLPAVKLYEKLGFKYLYSRKDYYGKNKNAAVYVKIINGDNS